MGTILDDGIKLLIILAVCLMVFGPRRLPEVARQLGGFIARARKFVEDALEQIRQESDLKDLNLPDLRVGSLRSQATQYVRELIDVDGQVAELRRAASVDELRAQTQVDFKAMVRPAGAASAGAAPAAGGGSAPGDGTAAPGGPEGAGDATGGGATIALRGAVPAAGDGPPPATVLPNGAVTLSAAKPVAEASTVRIPAGGAPPAPAPAQPIRMGVVATAPGTGLPPVDPDAT